MQLYCQKNNRPAEGCEAIIFEKKKARINYDPGFS